MKYVLILPMILSLIGIINFQLVLVSSFTSTTTSNNNIQQYMNRKSTNTCQLIADCANTITSSLSITSTQIQLQSNTIRNNQGISNRRRSSSSSNSNSVSALYALPVAVTNVVAAATPIVSIIASPIGSLGVLLSIVLIHECGHYLAARTFNITVEEFSVGVGPKVFGTTAFGNEFNLRLLPLGGYVRFPENYNLTLNRQYSIVDDQQYRLYIQEQNFNIGIQIINALSLGIVIDKMWENEKNNRRTLIQQQQKEITKIPLWWQRITSQSPSLSKVTTKSTQIIQPVPDEIEYYTTSTLLQNRPWYERFVVLSGGVIFNLLTAFIIYFTQIGYSNGLPQPIFDNGIVVSAQPQSNTPSFGLLQQGDILLTVNGKSILRKSSLSSSSSSGSSDLQSSPSALQSSQAVTEFINTVRNTPDGDSMVLDVVRNKKEIEVTIQPKRIASLSSPQTIGVLLTPNYIKSELIKTDSPLVAAELAYKYVSTATYETANGLLQLFKVLIVGTFGSSSASSTNNNDVTNQVSGPIGLIRTGSQVIATQDITNILLFAAAISINLGVVNALPIPALDGGQIVFVLIEAITGKKVNQRLEETITSIFVLFLIIFSANTLFGDISNIITGK